jgi:AraC-like DNA-binding protein
MRVSGCSPAWPRWPPNSASARPSSTASARAQLGRGALELLHARIALEAQRQLAYTTQSVKHIGLDLGFADPGYFTRFFQRLCGSSPSWQ